ncbi:hypothetical protein JNUCC1_01374 [Lentibacillus sp. JNUCC-1]|uniref:ECF transporter S component n=1 Tax=Lentibacillus sp. JNUCC-1 TaxID=2654513 RepID=UPI0012E77411|nr:ECF transporter S component [Lentibacillus sp. JNUCC-1]MUV37568.1 hypothetical protein [Lentibacillus sp. JNUCC-1]
MAVRSRLFLAAAAVLIALLLGIMYVLYNYHAYFLLSMIILAATMIPFFIRFEWRDVQAREVVILAMLAAVAAVSRVPFAGLPSVQPTTFVIIVAGIVFGAESGFMVGAVAAIVSNIFLGQGPWTPWQMYAWGMIGMTAGLLKNTWIMRNTWMRLVFGFVWGILFGWIMNLWIVTSNMENVSWEFLITLYANSISHDVSHALSNVFFLAVFGASWIRTLERFQKKYDLLR